MQTGDATVIRVDDQWNQCVPLIVEVCRQQVVESEQEPGQLKAFVGSLDERPQSRVSISQGVVAWTQAVQVAAEHGFATELIQDGVLDISMGQHVVVEEPDRSLRRSVASARVSLGCVMRQTSQIRQSAAKVLMLTDDVAGNVSEDGAHDLTFFVVSAAH